MKVLSFTPRVRPAMPVPNWTPPDIFTELKVSCPSDDCGADLLIDSPEDLVYYVHLTFYGGDIDPHLGVICPASKHYIDLEYCPKAGSPVDGPRSAQVMSPKFFQHFPDSARTRAYEKWESAQSTEYWKTYFSMRDFRYWAVENEDATAALRARLYPV